MNLEELCSWLSHQKGMMAQIYAKELAKYIVRTKEPQIKELSDEEIKDLIATFPIIFTPNDLLSFARAILKKASNK